MKTALEIFALLLPRDDREVVLGDLEEQGTSGLGQIIAILDFVIRQQVEYWRDWRPWVVGGAVIPATLVLLGLSFQLSLDVRSLWLDGHLQAGMLHRAALMIAWAWTGGFVVGALSRRTGWASPLLFTIPCASCLMEFREPALSSLCLLLFLPPALVGTFLGRRGMRMGVAPSLGLAIAIMALMLLWRGMPGLNWLLLLPALYLAWTFGTPSKPNEGALS